MLQALKRFAQEFETVLHRLGLNGKYKVRLTRNRTAAVEQSAERRARKPRRTHPDDLQLAQHLTEWHARYNADHFEGRLKSVPIGISRRMRSRLGHYSAATADGLRAEIVISRRHFRRHGWDETLHTLLHEMVHQWQDESGQEIDHGREFRRKARAVGVAPHATRRVA